MFAWELEFIREVLESSNVYIMYLASYKKRLCGKNDGEIKRHKSCFILRASSGFCFSVGIYGVAKISFLRAAPPLATAALPTPSA